MSSAPNDHESSDPNGEDLDELLEYLHRAGMMLVKAVERIQARRRVRKESKRLTDNTEAGG
jgi:hypothetical protein